MTNWTETILSLDSTVEDAIRNLNDTGARIVLIADSELKFVGVIADGDIRRGMVKGVNLTDCVTEIINKKSITVLPELTRSNILAIMEKLKVLQIPIVDKSGRLLGLHTFGETPNKETHENLFVIMAGGFGRRMGSLTSKTPKPMLKVFGKPILQHIIEAARDNGFCNFVIAVHYLGDTIENYFGNGRNFGVNIKYVREESPLGTAGALTMIEPIPKMPFVVSNADLISNIDLAELLDFHLSNQAEATVTTRTVHWQNPFGVVEIQEGIVGSILEKPIISSSVSAGIYVFNPVALELLERAEFCDMPTLLAKMIERNFEVRAFPIFESLQDIGQISDWEKAQEEK